MDNEDVIVSRRERFSSEGNNKGGNKTLPIIIGIVVLVLIGVGAFIFMNKDKSGSTDTSLNGTPTGAPTEEPVPTEIEVDVSKYNIQVLNGTETAGEAGKLKTALTDAGYKVAGTGNADKTTYKKTIIQAKADVDAAFVDKLKSELEGTYPVGTSEELDADNENDVVVIIGMEPKETTEASDEAETTTAPSSSPSPSPSATPTP